MQEDNLLAPCGDFCMGCAQYNGLAVALASSMREIADLYGFEYRSQATFDFGEFLKGLNWFIANATCPGCREGGGPQWCEVKSCSFEKGLHVCFECDDFPCSKIEDVADPDTMDRYHRFCELGQDAWIAKQVYKAKQGYEIHLRKVVHVRPSGPHESATG